MQAYRTHHHTISLPSLALKALAPPLAQHEQFTQSISQVLCVDSSVHATVASKAIALGIVEGHVRVPSQALELARVEHHPSLAQQCANSLSCYLSINAPRKPQSH